MANWREWLDRMGFDWDSGVIVYQPIGGDREYSTPGWDTPDRGEYINPDHDVLDREFDSGFGGPQAPRIVAEDANAIYFVSQYDGATRPQKIWKDLTRYTGDDPDPSPYPGG